MKGAETMQKNPDDMEAWLRLPNSFKRRFPKPHNHRVRIFTPEKADLPEAKIEPISAETESILYR